MGHVGGAVLARPAAKVASLRQLIGLDVQAPAADEVVQFQSDRNLLTLAAGLVALASQERDVPVIGGGDAMVADRSAGQVSIGQESSVALRVLDRVLLGTGQRMIVASHFILTM